ncbi:MAG: ABC-2 transporter permease, partial [Clostridiales bacterium]|nr:ABC-2 transporter permease [Clostridiales bacterium]
MAGLLEKDLRLLLSRKQSIVMFLLLAVVLGFTQAGTFILGYLPFLGVILTISTISYDEVDNGYTFLMTLPIDRKTYVKEKFLFCISGAVSSWILAVVLYFLSGSLHGDKLVMINEIPMVLTFLAIVILLMAIMIPFQIKFGAEKSRIVMLIIFGIITVVSFVFVKIIGQETMNEIIEKMEHINETY